MRYSKHTKIVLIGSFILSGLMVSINIVPPGSCTLKQSTRPPQTYISHAPILIIGNTNFSIQATGEGWTGDGSKEAPYVINGLNITGPADSTLISIYNTTVHFQISNCLIQEGFIGIRLENVTNGQLINNTVTNTQRFGIYFIYLTRNCVLMNNTVSNIERTGIRLLYSRNNTVTANRITNNGERGISLGDSQNDTLLNNRITNNGGYGIFLSDSVNTTLIGNWVANNNDHGIWLYDGSWEITLTGNLITNNTGHGIFLRGGYDESRENSLTGNIVVNNTGHGFYLNNNARMNILVNNTVFYNSEYGIHIDSTSNNNTMHFNNFYGHTVGGAGSQAQDDGVNNSFMYNYWGEWTTPDSNNDGLVDSPYTIAGSATTQDPFPLSSLAMGLDFDADGLPDAWEVNNNLDPGTDDTLDDPDDDKLANRAEYLLGTDPHHADSDADGLNDGDEVLIYNTNPLDPDSDTDGLTDGAEVLTYTTNPLDSDSDKDGLSDLDEVIKYNTNPNKADSDGDGLTDNEEINKYNTDPLDADSDNDFFRDGWDNGWWGNPHNNWDNPLTRGGLLCFLLLCCCGLIIWARVLAFHSSKLHQDLELLFQHFQHYAQHFQESVTTLQHQASLEELEALTDHIYLMYQSYENFFFFAQQLVNHKWLPPFLRPDLVAWEVILETMTHTLEEFQQTRIKRLDAKY